MNDQGAKVSQPKRGRRLAVRALVVLVLLLGGVWIFRERIAVFALRRAATAAGIEVSWRKLDLDGLSAVRLEELSVRRAGDLDLEADRIEIEFDLWKLVRGDLGGLERIDAERLRGQAGPFHGGTSEPKPAKPFRLPSGLPKVDLTTGALEVRLPGDRAVTVRDLALSFDGVHARGLAPSLAWIDRGHRTDFPLDVLGSVEGNRFEIERAAWDPRIVVEAARVEVDDVRAGLVRFEGGVRGFGGSARVLGRLEDGVVHAAANVSRLDFGALADAWAAELRSGASGVFDVRLSASIPLADPAAFECSALVLARDAHVFRSVDELSGRVVVTQNGIAVRDGLLVHGENAIHFIADAPPIGTDGCEFLQRTRVFADGVLGDPRALLAGDIGLTLKSDEPWTREPLYIAAALAFGDVAAHAWTRGADLGPIVSAFAGESPAEAALELEADVKLPLADASRIVVDGVAVATYAAVADHVIDTAVSRVRWSSDGLDLQDLSAVSGANSVDVGWARVPPSAFAACAGENLRDVAVSGLFARLDDLPALLAHYERSPELEHLVAHRLEFDGSLEGGELVLVRGEFATNAGVARIERGRVPLQGDLPSIVHDPALDLELELHFADVSEAAATLAPGAFAQNDLPRGAVAGSARVRGRREGPAAALDLSARELVLDQIRFDEVDVRAELDERAVRVDHASSRGALGTFELSGSWLFAEERIVDARLEADVVDVSRLAPARLPAGALTASIRADGKLADIDASVDVHASDLAWPEGARVDELVVKARAVRGAWTVEEARARGHGLEAALSGKVSSLDPEATSRSIVLDTLTLGAGATSAGLTAPATIVQQGGVWSVDGLDLEGTAGKARLSIRHEGEVSHLDAVLAAPIPRSALELVGIESGAAQVDASIELLRNGRDLAGKTSGTIATQGVPEAGALHAEWSATLSDRRVTIGSFSIRRGEGERASRATIAGEFPLDPLGQDVLADGPLALRIGVDAVDLALLPFLRSAWGASGGAKLDADFGGSWTAVTGTLAAKLEDAALTGVKGAAEMGRVSGTAQVAFGASTRLDAVDLVVDDTLRLRASGSIAAPFNARALTRGDVEPTRSAALDLALNVDAEDLGPVATRLPSLRRTRGRVHAELHASGSIAEPRFTGEGTLDEGEIRTTTNLPSIVGVSSRVTFDGTHLVVEDLTGEMGGAPFSMKGRVRVLGGAPEVDLKLEGSSLLLWRERDVTVRADADLRLFGALDELTLSGDLALRDSRFTKKFDLLALGKRGPKTAAGRGLRLFAFEEPPFSTMRFDVNVTSATPFKIASNLVRGGLSPALALHGTGALPELRGSVIIEPSRVLLPTGSVRVRSGRIEFTPAQPDVPELDIQASARIQGYDISITVTGAYDEPRIELSSVPPLSREDLALLLITGTPPGNTLDSTAGQRAAMDLAVYIARDVAVAWFEADEDEVESLAERLEVVVGADTTKSGADAVLVRLRVSGDLHEDRRAIFVTGEKDVYEFYNFGLRFVLAFP